MTKQVIWTQIAIEDWNGARRVIEKCAAYPGVQRVTTKSFGNPDEDSILYRASNCRGTLFDTLEAASTLQHKYAK